MRKTLIFTALSLLFIGQIYAVTPVHAPLAQENKITNTYNVRIKLLRDGVPVTGPVGLQGFWALNLQTGVYYDPTERESYEFEALPAGTYTFGAYPGPWEGAVSRTVTLDASQVGPDGFIEVSLSYWVE
jgi:hypothetical protein